MWCASGQDGGGEASGEEVASGEERPPKRPRLAEGEDEGERDKEEEEAGEIAEEVPEAAPLSLEEAIVDDAGLASGALMRDIHLGLLSVLDGSAAKNASGVPQPRFVRPMAVEGNGPFWPERVHDVLNKADDIQLNWAELFPALPDAMKVAPAQHPLAPSSAAPSVPIHSSPHLLASTPVFLPTRFIPWPPA